MYSVLDIAFKLAQWLPITCSFNICLLVPKPIVPSKLKRGFCEFCEIFQNTFTARKVSKYGVFSGPCFPAFGLNTERCSVFFRIQSKCGKILTRKNSLFGHFSCEAVICSRTSPDDCFCLVSLLLTYRKFI